MEKDETSGGRSVLTGLLASLRLPERVFEALDELRAIHSELTRVRKQTKPLDDLLPALQSVEEVLGNRLESVYDVVVALEGEDSHLHRTTSKLSTQVAEISDLLAPVNGRLAILERTIHELARDVTSINETLSGVKDDIQRMSGLRGERGIMERARDVITGGSKEEDMAVSNEDRPSPQPSASGPREQPSS